MLLVYLILSTILLCSAAAISNWGTRSKARGTAKELGIDTPPNDFEMFNKNKRIQYRVWENIKNRDFIMSSRHGYNESNLIPYDRGEWVFHIPIENAISNNNYKDTPYLKEEDGFRYYNHKSSYVYRYRNCSIGNDYNIYTNKWDKECPIISDEESQKMRERFDRYKIKNRWGGEKYRRFDDVKIVELTQQELEDKLALDEMYSKKIRELVNLDFEKHKSENPLLVFDQWEDARLTEIKRLVNEATSYDVCWRWLWDERIYANRQLKMRPYETERENTRKFLERMLEHKYSDYANFGYLPEIKMRKPEHLREVLSKAYRYREWYPEDGVERIMEI